MARLEVKLDYLQDKSQSYMSSAGNQSVLYESSFFFISHSLMRNGFLQINLVL